LSFFCIVLHKAPFDDLVAEKQIFRHVESR